MSIHDITQNLLLSDKQVIGLESDDHSSFYTLLYAERAATLYAEFLAVGLHLEGAPPFKAVVEFEAKPSEPARRHSKESLQYRYAIATLFVVTLVGLIVAKVYDIGEKSPITKVPAAEMIMSPPTSMEPPQVAITQTEQTAASSEFHADDKSNRFFIVINKPTTVIARDATGKLLLSGEQVPSSGKRIVGKPPFTLAVVDPEAVEIYYQGKRIRQGRSDTPAITITTFTKTSP